MRARKSSWILWLGVLLGPGLMAGAAAEPRTYSTVPLSRDAGRRPPAPPAPADPAVERYWSKPCVRARERGDVTRPDCHHPDFSGSGYGWRDHGYGDRHRPRFGAGPILILPQVVVPPRGHGHQAPAGSGLGTWRDW